MNSKTSFPIKANTPSLGATALGGLIAGVVTGATLATVSNVSKVRKGKISKEKAVANIMREASSMGAATTVGVTATALLGITGVLSIAGVALVTAGTKYAIDNALDKVNNQECLEENNASENDSIENIIV